MYFLGVLVSSEAKAQHLGHVSQHGGASGRLLNHFLNHQIWVLTTPDSIGGVSKIKANVMKA